MAAEDSAGGSLSYAWDVSEGWAIEGSGDTARVTAPEESGVQGRVTVTVSNDAGDSATDSVDLVTVDCDDSPIACELLAWSMRHPISIDTSQVQEPLTDVPILLVLDASRIDYDAAASGGEDLRIATGSLDELLDHEIDTWDRGGTSYVWVRVPELAPDGGSVELWMYYGNPAAGDGQNAAGVWDDDFRAVWHGAVSGDELRDSSANANDATSPLADWSDRLVSGLLGRAVLTDGSDGADENPPDTYFEIGAVDASLDLEGPFTLEAVVEIDPDWPEVDWAIVQKGPAGNEERYLLGLSRRDQIINCRVFPEAEGTQIRNDSPEDIHPGDVARVSLGTITYLVCTYDGDTLAAFVDGDRVQTLPLQAGGSLVGGAEPLFIGRRFDDRRFGGLIDEIRISSTARSEAWIRVQQLAFDDALVAIGDREELR